MARLIYWIMWLFFIPFMLLLNWFEGRKPSPNATPTGQRGEWMDDNPARMRRKL